MLELIKKIFFSIKDDGFKTSFKKIKIFLIMKKKRKFKKKIFQSKSIEDKFTKIYNSNYWSDKESRSGEGSNLIAAKQSINHIPKIIKKFKIRNIFDAPCGDFNWMQRTIIKKNLKYIGADIVKTLIKELNKKYSTNLIKFKHIDIIKQKLPNADLMICRDCLFHFSNKDIKLFFFNLKKSKIKYILTTSHFIQPKMKPNKNISTGDFRKIDIFSYPFKFKKKSVLYYFKDFKKNSNNQSYMFLFKIEDIVI